MRARYRSENGVVRLAQVPPVNALASVVVREDFGDAFVLWHASMEVVSSAGTGDMMFGIRIGGVGQPFGLDRHNLSFAIPGTRSQVFGGGLGVLRPGTVVELFGRMLSADQVDLVAQSFVLGVL